MRYEDQRRGFTIDVVSVGATAIVATIGEVDMHTAPRLEEAIDHALATRPRRLVVDLSRVGFFDSSGLNVLLRVVRDRELRVVGSEVVRRLIELTGLTEVIRMFGTVDDALAGPSPVIGGRRDDE